MQEQTRNSYCLYRAAVKRDRADERANDDNLRRTQNTYREFHLLHETT